MPSLPPRTQLLRDLLRILADPAQLTAKSKRPPVAHMLLAAQLTTAFGSSAAVRAIATPMTITLIVVPDMQLLGRLEDALSFGLAGLSDVVDMDLMTDVSQVIASEYGSSDEARRREKFRANVDIELGLGKAIIALVPDANYLSSGSRVLPTTTYDLPAIDGIMLTEVMRSLRRAPSRRLSAMLSNADRYIARLPFAIVVGALRQSQTGAAVETILRAAQRLEHSPSSGSVLEDLHLSADLRRYLDGVIADIDDWRGGRVDWSEISTSALLYGPPGNGKTSIAKALANTAGLNLVVASFAESASAGPLSDYLKSMNAKVTEAILHPPSLFFIDEIDTYTARSGNGDHNDTYMMLVVNHLLEVLSRLDQAPGVTVMGATNHPSHVDPAIRRAGRLDAHLHIGPPDRDGIEHILRVQLGDADGAFDLTAAARSMVGLSGADVENTARQALSIARRERRSITVSDLEQVAQGKLPVGFSKDIRRIALHEAGHAVVRAAVGLPLPKSALLSATASHVASDELTTLRAVEIDQLMATLLGGRAAEMLYFGDASSGAETDIAQATSYALACETRLCLDVVVPLYAPHLPDAPETWPEDMRSAILRRMSAAQKTAFHAIKANDAVLHAVSDALIAERELGADQLAALLAKVTPVPLVSRPCLLPIDQFIGE